MELFFDFLPDKVPFGVKIFIYILILLHLFAIV